MSVIDAPIEQATGGSGFFEVTVEASALRTLGCSSGHIDAAAELDRVQRALVARGLGQRSAERVVTVFARYAFLVEGGCDPAAMALWRLFSVDVVPTPVIAKLNWQQVRLHLREIAAPHDDALRYFDLSQGTCRVLRQMREQRGDPGSDPLLFRQSCGVAWDAESLEQLMSLIGPVS